MNGKTTVCLLGLSDSKVYIKAFLETASKGDGLKQNDILKIQTYFVRTAWNKTTASYEYQALIVNMKIHSRSAVPINSIRLRPRHYAKMDIDNEENAEDAAAAA